MTEVDAVPPIKRPRGRPRRRPAKGHGDKAYEAERHRAALRRRHIRPLIARRADIHAAFLQLGAVLLTWDAIQRFG